jgi:hypothetical protein
VFSKAPVVAGKDIEEVVPGRNVVLLWLVAGEVEEGSRRRWKSKGLFVSAVKAVAGGQCLVRLWDRL